MRTRRFTWSAFDDATVLELAKTLGFEGRGDPRAWLSTHAPSRPDLEFVRETKKALERTWLKTYAGTPIIVERLRDAGVGPLGAPSTRSPLEYIQACRNTSTVQRLLREALLRFGDADRAEPEDPAELAAGFAPRFAILRPKDQPVDPRRAHDYQEAAWQQLSKHEASRASTQVFQGLLVMPTGAGKTFTTVHWVMREVLNRNPGGKVLWLAHRHELLNQAAREFHRLAGLAPGRESLRVRIVSAVHCSTSQIDHHDDVILASIASLARNPQLVDDLLKDQSRLLVIDEAHHAPAKSYRDILDRLGASPSRRILGITATPTRTALSERPLLSRLFGDRVLFEVHIRQLIERGLLARPIAVTVDTRIDAEAGITDEDRQHLAQFDDLSAEWMDRLAHESRRNAVVVQHLVENREKYGKTLIFAINVRHAALLAEDLRRAGVRAEYVASYRPDGEPCDTADVLERFRKEKGDLDVLVNVQMLTEGVDLPSVQTVMLTRPTVSETLLRQMIGRALRGPAAGGTATAFIVSFEDHWEQFPDWQDPLALVSDLLPQEEAQPREADPALVARLAEGLPWELIRSTAAHLRAQGPALQADAFEAVPVGWYLLERAVDGDDVRQVIAVYAHQTPCWEALFDELATASPATLTERSEESDFENFFGDCDLPRPSRHEFSQAMAHLRAGGDRPEFKSLKDRERCDPHALAKEIWTQDLGEKGKSSMLAERYSPLAQAIYPSLRDFRGAVEDALYEIQHPDESTRVVRAVPVFHPLPSEMMREGGNYDLSRLMQDVLARGQSLLKLTDPLPFSATLKWTKKKVKGWYGMAYPEQGKRGAGEIRINCLLNSPDVPVETIRFLLWHEYLHLYLSRFHDREFRKAEKLWPGSSAADHVLDSLNERFGVQYW